MKVSILLLAAGQGTRLGGPVPKAFVDCAGTSLIERSLQRLSRLGQEREIILAVNPEHRESHLPRLLDQLRSYGLNQIVDGGETRLESMRNALAASDPEFPLVLVHDAARPFFSLTAAEEALEKATEVGAALLAAPAPDTLKRAKAQRISETIDRTNVWLAQTPQVMRRDLLDEALAKATADGFQCTDDVSLFEHAGFPVALVASSPENLKVTNAEDLALAELIAHKKLT